jgi:hypothetical protein
MRGRKSIADEKTWSRTGILSGAGILHFVQNDTLKHAFKDDISNQ